MPRQLIAPALLLAGCQVANPVFMLGSAGNEGGSSSAGPGTSTSGAASTGDPTSSGDPAEASASAAAADPTTGGPDTEATTAVDPTTTGGTTTTSGTTTTGGESSSGGASGTTTTGGEESSSGGEESTGAAACIGVDDEVYVALYPLCGAPGTTWTGGAGNDYGVTCGSVAKPAQVLPHDTAAVGQFMLEFCDVLELVAVPAVGGYVEGVFTGLTLAPNQAMDAEFFTSATCVVPELNGTCNVQASAWVSYEGMVMALPVSKQVANLATQTLTIPIYLIPGVAQGKAFDLHLKLHVNGAGDAKDRAYFIDPRIRKKGG